ncbi:hypothetical protein [Streptomyces sp. NPDC051001]|uniref:hypothetical protein n=1 Tax=Streptomyces sp. NPDC051001 TaxID=3155795 RepID=UPI003441935A
MVSFANCSPSVTIPLGEASHPDLLARQLILVFDGVGARAGDRSRQGDRARHAFLGPHLLLLERLGVP